MTGIMSSGIGTKYRIIGPLSYLTYAISNLHSHNGAVGANLTAALGAEVEV